MFCNVIKVNKYKHFWEFISFSFSPSVTSVELSISVFIIPNNTRYPPRFLLWLPFLHLTARTPQRTHTHCCKVYAICFTHTRWILLFVRCFWFIMSVSRFICLNGADRCVYLYTPQRNKEMRDRWLCESVCVRSRTSGSPLSRSHRSFSVENPNRRLFIYRNRKMFKFCQNCPSRAAHLSSFTDGLVYNVYISDHLSVCLIHNSRYFWRQFDWCVPVKISLSWCKAFAMHCIGHSGWLPGGSGRLLGGYLLEQVKRVHPQVSVIFWSQYALGLSFNVQMWGLICCF